MNGPTAFSNLIAGETQCVAAGAPLNAVNADSRTGPTRQAPDRRFL